MLITLAEYTENPQKYLKLSASEDVYITQRGQIIARLKKKPADSSGKKRPRGAGIAADITAAIKARIRAGK